MGVWLRKSSHRFHGFAQMVGCVNSPTEFTEFTEVLLRRSSHGIHRSFVALIRPRNSQNSQKFGGAVGCVGMAGCHTLLHLCKSVPICGRYFSARRFRVFRAFCGNIVSHGFHRLTQMVGCVNSPTDFTDQHRWLVALIRPRNSQNSQKFWGAVGSVGMAGCHTLLICAHPCQSVGGISLPEGSVRSVRSVGGFSQPEECVLWEVFLDQKSAFCGRFFSTRRVSSVGDYNFSMRKRLTMPKTRA